MKKISSVISLLVLVLLLLAGINTSYGFDVDGLKNGMEKKKVLEILSPMNFDKVVDEGSTVKFCDLQDKKYNRFYVVYFKNNKLIRYNKNYEPSMLNYITLFKLLNEQYGMAVLCSSQSNMMSNGESKSLHCSWRLKKELVTISYDILPSHDNLYVHYLIK